MTSKKLPLLAMGAGLCLLASPASAGDAIVSAGTLSVQPSSSGISNMTLSVSGPDGFSAQKQSSFGAPSVTLSEYTSMADGTYTWQLTGATTERIRDPQFGFNNGRDTAEPEFINRTVTETGSFRVIGGVVQIPDGTVEDDSDGGAN